MKRTLALFLVIIMCLSICSCASKKDLIDDEELSSKLNSAIFAKATYDLAPKTLVISMEKMKTFGFMSVELKSIEETESKNYCVIGELFIRWKDKRTGEFSDEYNPFTAYVSQNSDGKYSCDDLELELGKDSLFRD